MACPKGRPHFCLFTIGEQKFKLIKPYKIMVITAWVSIFEKSLCCTLLGVRPAKWEIALHIFAFMVYVECMFNNQSQHASRVFSSFFSQSKLTLCTHI